MQKLYKDLKDEFQGISVAKALVSDCFIRQLWNANHNRDYTYLTAMGIMVLQQLEDDQIVYLGTNKWKYTAVIVLSSENLKPDGHFKLRSVSYFPDKEVLGYFLFYRVHIHS